MPRANAAHGGRARPLLDLDELRDKLAVPIAVEGGEFGVGRDRFFPAGFGKSGFEFHMGTLGIELSRDKRAGDPGGSGGAHLSIGFDEPCPFLETNVARGPPGRPRAQTIEVDRCDGIGLKNRRKVEVEKFYRIGEGVDYLVEAGFEMIAMCFGGEVADKADDALGVEMRIEGGQLPGCPGNLVDQAKDRPFFLPDIAQKARQDPSLGGEFAAQRLAREDRFEEREPVGRPPGNGTDNRLASVTAAFR